MTVWRANSFDEAIEKAETEAREYSEVLSGEYLGLAQAYKIDGALEEGSEVFSLMRSSELEPTPHLNHFFDNGKERQRRSLLSFTNMLPQPITAPSR